MWHRVLAAAALAAALASVRGDDLEVEQCGVDVDGEDHALLQRQHGQGLSVDGIEVTRRSRFDVQGKSVYLVMTDRFARSDGNSTACTDGWCGGTFKGIQDQLPYIKGMGFECIWITPVVENPAVEDKHNTTCHGSGYGYHGYWAQNYYKTDPHFGDNDEFKALVRAAHKEGLCVMLDIVMNHMGPIHPWEPLSVSKKIPFDKPEYYHQVDRGSLSWDDYTAKYCSWPPAAQSMGPGALCRLDVNGGVPDYTNNGTYCNNYVPANGPYNSSTYLGDKAAGPASLKYCGVGNFDCPGYNQTLIWEGWFYDLGDLNHSHPFVVEKQLEWIRWVREEFKVDSIRLDTAPYMPWDFLGKLQDAARPMQIHGEVTSTNISFHASFQTPRELAGLENFPPFYTATPGFCGDDGQPSSPTSMWDLRELGRVMAEQLKAPYSNLQSLMNFADNQDYNPIANTCKQDATRIRNILTWVFFSYGMPTVTWGTETGNTVYRNSLWQYGWNTTTWQYTFIKTLNEVRKATRVSHLGTKVEHASEDLLVFKRFRGFARQVWVYTTSRTGGAATVYPVVPRACRGKCWFNKLTGDKAVFKDGKLHAPNAEPLVLVERRC